ncbi:DUF3784 domain-containing protein [Clostridium septicum]|nr:DUF3784 domain-containing protein [Clostridium septicum]MDU1313727.1 DUF3784 domain-containing protein [Clostridium septicum]UEC21636.1 DUF3784 domain-containing protein [Clostridium septicum]USS00314.1 DUF3784 domain-containing protein [Clostridium septicum]WLF68865.1 DUF3784 domain-containing protein [Clostridium septicum]
MGTNLAVIFIFSLLAGTLFLVLGGIIKHFNAGDMINFFNEKKHDKDKFSRIVGNNFLIIGFSIMLISIISIFVDKSYYIYILNMQATVILFGIIITIYQVFKYGNK